VSGETASGEIYRVQAGWPQSQAISASSEPASLHNWLQYFSPAGGTHTQDRCAHFFAFSFAMTILLGQVFSWLPGNLKRPGAGKR
jgi:hypothetical protein